MKVNFKETVEILDLEEKLGIELIVSERSNAFLPRFHASFPRLLLVTGDIWKDAWGDGDTIDEAIKDYAQTISGSRVSIATSWVTRKEQILPRVVHTRKCWPNKGRN